METNNNKAVNLAQLIAAHQKSNTKLTALANQIEELVTTGGEPNVITAVKNNGTALEVIDKAVDIGPSIAAAVTGSDHLKRKKVDSVDAIDVSAADAAQYIYMVPKTGGKNGDKYDEYMVLDGEVEPEGDWSVDLSGYQVREEGKGLSTNDFTDEDKAKLDGIEFATEADYNAMIARVFGGE